MANYIATDTEFTTVANKIRAKSGGTEPLAWPDGFAAEIEGISGGGAPNLQAKTATPSETAQTVTADSGYDGLSEVDVEAIPGSYVGSGVTRRSSSDLTASGDTVTAPAGYYESAASKAVASGSAATPATSITANPSISVSSGGLITASVSKSQSVTPSVSPGYVSSGTAGTVSVSGSATQQLTAQAAQTIHPSASDQVIAADTYLTGAQTVKGVVLTNLTAENIKKDVVVKVGDADDDDCVANVTGTYEGGGGGGGAASGTVTPAARSLTLSFDTGLSSVSNVLVVPTSETPLKSGGKTVVEFIGTANDYFKSIFVTSNNAGSNFLTPNFSTSDTRFALSGTTVTVTSAANTGGYFEAIEYTWYAW